MYLIPHIDVSHNFLFLDDVKNLNISLSLISTWLEAIVYLTMSTNVLLIFRISYHMNDKQVS